MTDMDFEGLRADHPDLLENTALPKELISRPRKALFTRLSDFDGMDDIKMLRGPGINWRIIKAVRSERARIDAK